MDVMWQIGWGRTNAREKVMEIFISAKCVTYQLVTLWYSAFMMPKAANCWLKEHIITLSQK